MNGPKVDRTLRPETKFVMDLLDNGEWWTVDELVEAVRASGIELKEYGRRKHSKDQFRDNCLIMLNAIADRSAYEKEMGKRNGRRAMMRLRKSPYRRKGQKLTTCGRCGRHDLSVHDRVRRVVDIRVPRSVEADDNGRAKRGDLGMIRVESTYLCLPCVKEELDAKGIWDDPAPHQSDRWNPALANYLKKRYAEIEQENGGGDTEKTQ